MSDHTTTAHLFGQLVPTLENLLTHVRGSTECGPGCIYNSDPWTKQPGCSAHHEAARLVEQIRGREAIVLDMPDTDVSDMVAAAGVGLFTVQRGKVLHTSTCEDCLTDSHHLVEADVVLKIAAALALIANRAAANPDPAHDLAIHMHQTLCGGIPSGAEACDCMRYAETALKLLAPAGKDS